MAKYTLEEIMCGEKYNIESDVFMEVFRLVEQKADAKMIREQLNTIYVMDHKLIPHINTGHATHKYLVLKEDAEKFLVRLGTDQKLIAMLKGQFPHEGERHPKPFFVASEENCTAFHRWLEKRWAELPDALPTLTAAQISGHNAQRIRELIKENILHGVIVNATQYIPKTEFISYLSSPEKLAIPRTEAYRDLIREFKKRQCRERENEIRRQKRKMARELN